MDQDAPKEPAVVAQVECEQFDSLTGVAYAPDDTREAITNAYKEILRRWKKSMQYVAASRGVAVMPHEHDLDVSGDLYCSDCDEVNIRRAMIAEVFGHLLKGRLVQLRQDGTIRVIEVERAEEVESGDGR